MSAGITRKLSAEKGKVLLEILEARFNKNMQRHNGLAWKKVKEKLVKQPAKLWSLNEMETSGGEPDVITPDKKNAAIIFFDCSPETPAKRRSLCYDQQALKERKQHKPKGSAMDAAASMGIELLDEQEYRLLQTFGEFDTKTSSWINTPAPIRKLGGALFGDFRYGQVFIYHNGAQSYYAARGFRGSLRI